MFWMLQSARFSLMCEGAQGCVLLRINAKIGIFVHVYVRLSSMAAACSGAEACGWESVMYGAIMQPDR